MIKSVSCEIFKKKLFKKIKFINHFIHATKLQRKGYMNRDNNIFYGRTKSGEDIFSNSSLHFSGVVRNCSTKAGDHLDVNSSLSSNASANSFSAFHKATSDNSPRTCSGTSLDASTRQIVCTTYSAFSSRQVAVGIFSPPLIRRKIISARVWNKQSINYMGMN